MSDDEEITFVKKPKTIHYGSLEEQERLRLATLAATDNEGDQKVVGGNINVSNGNQYFTELRESYECYLYVIVHRIFRLGGCNIQRQTSFT